MIGHNNGPPIGDINDVGGRARLYAWCKAHKSAWRTPPIEIVRLRDNAARRVGLGYKDYTSILLDRGRRVSAVFFQLEGALLRMRNGKAVADGDGFALMPGVRQKLQQLDCTVLIVSRANGLPAEALERCAGQISALCSRRVVDCAPPIGSGGAQFSAAIEALLSRHQLPPSQAIMVGDMVEAERAAAALGLARYLWAWHYFSDSLAGDGQRDHLLH